MYLNMQKNNLKKRKKIIKILYQNVHDFDKISI